MPDEIDDELQLALDNTSESWKRGLVIAARDARKDAKIAARRDRWILRIAGATLAVAILTLIVALLR